MTDEESWDLGTFDEDGKRTSKAIEYICADMLRMIGAGGERPPKNDMIKWACELEDRVEGLTAEVKRLRKALMPIAALYNRYCHCCLNAESLEWKHIEAAASALDATASAEICES